MKKQQDMHRTSPWHNPCIQHVAIHKPTMEVLLMAKIKIKPLADRVLVKRLDEEEEQKVGGIIIPDTAKEKPQEAEVVAIGPGRLEEGKHVAPEVKKGDKVLIGKYSGTEVKIDGDEYLIMREDDILAIVN